MGRVKQVRGTDSRCEAQQRHYLFGGGRQLLCNLGPAAAPTVGKDGGVEPSQDSRDEALNGLPVDHLVVGIPVKGPIEHVSLLLVLDPHRDRLALPQGEETGTQALRHSRNDPREGRSSEDQQSPSTACLALVRLGLDVIVRVHDDDDAAVNQASDGPLACQSFGLGRGPAPHRHLGGGARSHDALFIACWAQRRARGAANEYCGAFLNDPRGTPPDSAVRVRMERFRATIVPSKLPAIRRFASILLGNAGWPPQASSARQPLLEAFRCPPWLPRRPRYYQYGMISPKKSSAWDSLSKSPRTEGVIQDVCAFMRLIQTFPNKHIYTASSVYYIQEGLALREESRESDVLLSSAM